MLGVPRGVKPTIAWWPRLGAGVNFDAADLSFRRARILSPPAAARKSCPSRGTGQRPWLARPAPALVAPSYGARCQGRSDSAPQVDASPGPQPGRGIVGSNAEPGPYREDWSA